MEHWLCVLLSWASVSSSIRQSLILPALYMTNYWSEDQETECFGKYAMKQNVLVWLVTHQTLFLRAQILC